MHNPFTIGSMIQNPAEFVGRTAELQFLLTRLRSLQSCSVVGERRTGKSSLLYHLHQTGAARLGEAGFQFDYLKRDDTGYRYLGCGFCEIRWIEGSEHVWKFGLPFFSSIGAACL